MRFVSWILVNMLALGIAAWLFDGISVDGSTVTEKAVTLLLVGAIFGLVGAVVKPVVKFLSLPLIVLTLGLMLLVINALMLMLTSALSQAVGLGLHVDGFWTAVWGGLVIAIASAMLGAVLPDGRD